MDINTVRIRVPLGRGQTMYITPLSDIHEDAKTHDTGALRALIQERNKLKNHWYLGMGDFLEWILPGDKRYQPGSVIVPKESRPELIDDMLARQIRKYSRLKWLGLLSGNHEYKITKGANTNPLRRLCDGIKKKQGLKRDLFLGYTGRIWLVFDGQYVTRGTVRLLMHHGAWNGVNDAGFGGAMRWASKFPGWDVLMYGHNHQTYARAFDTDELSSRGHRLDKSQHVVCCGTFLRNWHPDYTTYSEQKGYGPIHIGAPLIAIHIPWEGPPIIKVTV
jgi:hypothetical protein